MAAWSASGAAGENGAKGVADSFEHLTAVPLDRRAQQFVVAGERAAHGFRIPVPEPGAALDVGKKKGERLRLGVRSYKHIQLS
jgi:hypothetical protein